MHKNNKKKSVVTQKMQHKTSRVRMTDSAPGRSKKIGTGACKNINWAQRGLPVKEDAARTLILATKTIKQQ